MGGLFRCRAKACADGEEHHGILGKERCVANGGEGAEDIDEVAADFGKDAMLKRRQVLAASEWKGVLVNGDDGVVFADDEPGPDAGAVR